MHHAHVVGTIVESAKKKFCRCLQPSVVCSSDTNAEVGEKVNDVADVGIRKGR